MYSITMKQYSNCNIYGTVEPEIFDGTNFQNPVTLLRIKTDSEKILNLQYNGALYVGIDIRRMLFFENTK